MMLHAIPMQDCGDGTQGAPYVVGDDDTGVLGGSDIIEYIIVDDAAGTATGVPGAIISVGDLAAAQAAVELLHHLKLLKSYTMVLSQLMVQIRT